MASPYRVTEDGYESQLAVNYLGHFLLTHMLLPNLRKAGKVGLNSRIVNVSSCIHHDGTINFDDIHSEYFIQLNCSLLPLHIFLLTENTIIQPMPTAKVNWRKCFSLLTLIV